MAVVPKYNVGTVRSVSQAPVLSRRSNTGQQARSRIMQQDVRMRELQESNRLEGERRVDRLSRSKKNIELGLAYEAKGIEIQQQVAEAQSLKSFGTNVTQAGNFLYQRAVQIRNQDDRREAQQMDLEFSRGISDSMFGVEDSIGFYSTKGERATGDTYQNTLDALDKSRADISERASNGRTRQMFEDAAQARLQRESISMARHVSKQRMVANNATSEAVILEASNQAIRYHDDPFRVNQSLDVIDLEIVEMGDRLGWSPEVLNIKRSETMSALHGSIIDRKMAVSPRSAREYFENSKFQIDPRLHSDIEKKLKRSSVRQDSQESYDDIISRVGDENSALTLARRIDDPEIRDAASVRIRQHFSDIDRIERREKREKFDDISVRAARGVEPREEDLVGMTQSDRRYVKSVHREQQKKVADPDYDRPGDGGATLNKFMEARGDRLSLGRLSFQQLRSEYELGVKKTTWDSKIIPIWANARNTVNREDVKRATAIEKDKRARDNSPLIGRTMPERINDAEETLGIHNNENLTTLFEMTFDAEYAKLPASDQTTKGRLVLLDSMVIDAKATASIGGQSFAPDFSTATKRGRSFGITPRQYNEWAFGQVGIAGNDTLQIEFLQEAERRFEQLDQTAQSEGSWKRTIDSLITEVNGSGTIGGVSYTPEKDDIGFHINRFIQIREADFKRLGIDDEDIQYRIQTEVDRRINNLPKEQRTNRAKQREWNNVIDDVENNRMVVDPGITSFFEEKGHILEMSDADKEDLAESLGIANEHHETFVVELDRIYQYLIDKNTGVTRSNIRAVWEARVAQKEPQS